jgi:hypothetical protein
MTRTLKKQRPKAEKPEQFLDLASLGYERPAAGVFDEPARCYRLNAEWAKIIFGWLDWLADEQAWTGTDEQRYASVQQLLRFFIPQECGTMTDCDDLADCIENNVDFQLVLNNFLDNALSDVQPNIDQPITQARRQDNLLPENVDCSLDNIFGIATGIVDALHNQSLDAIQIMELASTALELAATLGDNAGVFSLAPASALETANWLQDQIIDVYAGSYTDEVRDTIRCALFCNAKEGCALSLDDIFSTYAALAGVDLNGITSFDAMITNIISFFENPALNVVATFHLMIIVALRYGSEFFAVQNFYSLKTIIELASNNPDSDHEILCTTCADQFWEHSMIVNTGVKEWQIVLGTLESGRLKSIKYDSNDAKVEIVMQFGQMMKVRGAELFYQRVNGGVGTHESTLVQLRPIIGSAAGAVTLVNSLDPANFIGHRCGVRTATQGTFSCREILVRVNIGWQNSTTFSYLDSVRVWGEATPVPPGAAAKAGVPQCTP